MALYKYSQLIDANNSDAFDAKYHPSAVATNSGIYRCTGCGREIAHTKDTQPPPQNHHQHTPSQGPILWQMAVYAVTS